MFPTIDLIATLGGLVLPPAFDFIKKKFIKSENDTPERTIGSLATTKPEVLPQYVEALATLKNSMVKFFNRDVIGTPSMWVINLRAAIRPIGVILAFVTLGAIVYLSLNSKMLTDTNILETVTGVRLSCEVIISSWFGSRFSLMK